MSEPEDDDKQQRSEWSNRIWHKSTFYCVNLGCVHQITFCKKLFAIPLIWLRKLLVALISFYPKQALFCSMPSILSLNPYCTKISPHFLSRKKKGTYLSAIRYQGIYFKHDVFSKNVFCRIFNEYIWLYQIRLKKLANGEHRLKAIYLCQFVECVYCEVVNL